MRLPKLQEDIGLLEGLKKVDSIKYTRRYTLKDIPSKVACCYGCLVTDDDKDVFSYNYKTTCACLWTHYVDGIIDQKVCGM
jgi:hypothetical protein